MPTIAHLVYIPTVLVIGIVIGYVLGGRADKDAAAAKERAEQLKAARRKSSSPTADNQAEREIRED
jgi:hypothetical protein